jgi:hypothetical protein
MCADLNANLYALLAGGEPDFRRGGSQPDGAQEAAFRIADKEARARFTLEQDGSSEAIKFIKSRMRELTTKEPARLVDMVQRDSSLSRNVGSVESALRAPQENRKPQPVRSKLGLSYWRDEDLVVGADGQRHTPTSVEGRQILHRREAAAKQNAQVAGQANRSSQWSGKYNDQRFYRREDMLLDDRGNPTIAPNSREAQVMRERQEADRKAKERMLEDMRRPTLKTTTRELSPAERNAALPIPRK